MVPDLTMSSLGGCQIQYEEVRILDKIGQVCFVCFLFSFLSFSPPFLQGAFAKVFKALYKTEVIAVKQLTLNLGNGEEEDEGMGGEEEMENMIQVFDEFRREASLISSLQHTNIVFFKGAFILKC